MNPQRERLINAPWPAVALVGAMLSSAFSLQSVAVGVDTPAARLGFAPRDLALGVWQPLFTSLFLHGGWIHLLGNSAFALAFATPVARRMGLDPSGGVVFVLFYLACGVLSNLGFAALDPRDTAPLVGASGAIAGLMGAASRLMVPGERLAAFTSAAGGRDGGLMAGGECADRAGSLGCAGSWPRRRRLAGASGRLCRRPVPHRAGLAPAGTALNTITA